LLPRPSGRNGPSQRWVTKRDVAAGGQALDATGRGSSRSTVSQGTLEELRTTNPMESPFGAVQLRATAALRHKRVADCGPDIQAARRAGIAGRDREGATDVNGLRVNSSPAMTDEMAAPEFVTHFLTRPHRTFSSAWQGERMSLRAGGGDAPVAEPQNLIESQFFQQLLHLETQKALRLRYSISVLCVSVSEIPQRHDPSLTRYVAKTMIRRLRATDIATVLSPSAVGILLIDTKIESVRQVFDRATESFREYPVSLETRESRVMLQAGAVSFPGTATKASDLLRQAIAFMGRASGEETISLHLPD
jgi:hypothetical protein